MKRLLALLVCLSWGVSHAVPVCTVVQTASAANTSTMSPTISAATAGNLLVVFSAARTNTETSDVDPSGYTLISVGTDNAYEVWGKIAAGGETSASISWNGSSRGATILTELNSTTGWPAIASLLKDSTTGTSTVTSMRYRSLTVTADNLCAVQTAVKNTTTSSTNNITSIGVTGTWTAAGFATDNGTANSLAIGMQIQSQTTGTNLTQNDVATNTNSDSVNCRGLSMTFNMNNTVTPNITDVDTDESINYAQQNVVVTGTDFKSSQGDGFMRLIDGAVTSDFTIDSWADTSIQGDTVLGNVRFGSRTLRVQNSDDNNDDQAITITAPSGEAYIDISGLVTLDFNPAGAETRRVKGQPNRYYDSPDIANGDQLHCKRTAGSGSITLNADGTFRTDSTFTQMQCRKWHTNAWGSFQTWDLTGVPPTFSGPNP